MKIKKNALVLEEFFDFVDEFENIWSVDAVAQIVDGQKIVISSLEEKGAYSLIVTFSLGDLEILKNFLLGYLEQRV